jgi:UDP-N-acetylmuramoyl-tripeptide--D-alanyl-D-alanine ligase
MIDSIISLYSPKFATVIVYMLQATEYDPSAYLKWFWRSSNFNKIIYRKTLVMTRPAKLLLSAMRIGMLVQLVLAAVLIWKGDTEHNSLSLLGVIVFVTIPILWAHLIVLPLLAGRYFINKPISKRHIKNSKQTFHAHSAVKIAVAGSYGKTTMKEILLTVLSEGKKIAATPANRNVSISHAQFAKTLKGDEEVLIIEYGEGEPGDVARFTEITKPDIGIITGLAPAHLDKYKNLQQAGEDIFSLASALSPENVFVNSESEAAEPFIKDGYGKYGEHGALGWRVIDVKVNIDGLSFTMKKSNKVLKLKSRLLGRHLVGTLALVVALADKLGLNSRQIVAGISKVKPFEHRMQQYQLGGAWIIDDTYNGNIDGMKAGLELLKELTAKRKIYVTPGLVDQGVETKRVHQKLGEYIAAAKPEMVILIKHSVTPFIQKGLAEGNYKGELRIEEDPLDFYTNLEHFVAAGDLVVMQNDWPDNYY